MFRCHVCGKTSRSHNGNRQDVSCPVQVILVEEDPLEVPLHHDDRRLSRTKVEDLHP